MIVVNFNGAATLSSCLECIHKQTRLPDQIIVIDNGSTDDSLTNAMSAYPKISFVALGRNAGFAAANNYAAQMVDGCDWLALVNPDAFLAPDWVEQMLDAARRHENVASLASRLEMAHAPGLLDGAGDVLHVSGLAWRQGHGKPADAASLIERDAFSCCAAAALYRTDIFLQHGGFDERFFCYFEDVDLGFRLRLAGYRCRYVPAARATHVGSASSGGQHSAFAVYHGHRNLVWCYVKNMPIGLLLLFLPLHLVANFMVVAWFCLKGQGGVVWRAKWHALCGLPGVWQKRGGIQRHRKAAVRDIWSVLDKRLCP